MMVVFGRHGRTDSALLQLSHIGDAVLLGQMVAVHSGAPPPRSDIIGLARRRIAPYGASARSSGTAFPCESEAE